MGSDNGTRDRNFSSSITYFKVVQLHKDVQSHNSWIANDAFYTDNDKTNGLFQN